MSALSGPFGEPTPATPNGEVRVVSRHSVSRNPFCIGRPVDGLATPSGKTAFWLTTRSSAGAVVVRALLASTYTKPETWLGNGASVIFCSEYRKKRSTHSGVV